MTQSYTYSVSSPSLTTFTMPSIFQTSVSVKLWGGGGTNGGLHGGVGLPGSYVESTLTIAAGDTVQLVVGTAALGRIGGVSLLSGQFNGGNGGTATDEDNDSSVGGGGGAASAILINSSASAVAGGGAGGGGAGEDWTAGHNGNIWTAGKVTATTNGGNGGNGCGGGGGGGGGYLGGVNGTGTPDDSIGAQGGYGGQSYGSIIHLGLGAGVGLFGRMTLTFTRAPHMYVKDTTWKEITSIFVNKFNVWKPVDEVYVKSAGAWKLVASNDVLHGTILTPNHTLSAF